MSSGVGAVDEPKWLGFFLKESEWLGAVDCLLKCHVQEDILDVQLMDGLVDSQAEDGPNGGGLLNGTKGLIEVNAKALHKAAEDPPSLVAMKGAIRLELVLKDRLVDDFVDAWGVRDKLPCVVGEERRTLFISLSANVDRRG